jgi:hypothetical protein
MLDVQVKEHQMSCSCRRRDMPVKLKLEEKPTNLGNEVKHGMVPPVLYYHSTLTYGGVEALHGFLEAGKKRKSLLALPGITRRLPGLLARSLDIE